MLLLDSKCIVVVFMVAMVLLFHFLLINRSIPREDLKEIISLLESDVMIRSINHLS